MRCWARGSSISTCRRRRIASGARCSRRSANDQRGENLMYAFELTRPKTVADAAAALAKSGGKALAGGQSLVGAMKLRLAQPGAGVGLSGIADFEGIKKKEGG